MQSKSNLSITELESMVHACRHEHRIADLIANNAEMIKQRNNMTFILPISLQVVLGLYLGYTYKIPINRIAALYQLYANDLIVIIVTLLKSVLPIDEITENCTAVYDTLNGKFDIELKDDYKAFYEMLNRCKYENKLYIPPNLW